MKKINERDGEGFIRFGSPDEAFLWKDEILGQLSDGYWENASPFDHWRVWSDAEVMVGTPAGYYGFHPKRTSYGLANSELMDVVGDRMRIHLGLFRMLGDKIKPHETLPNNPGDVARTEKSAGEEANKYWTEKLEMWKSLGLTDELVQKAYDQTPLSDVTTLLRQMQKTMKIALSSPEGGEKEGPGEEELHNPYESKKPGGGMKTNETKHIRRMVKLPLSIKESRRASVTSDWKDFQGFVENLVEVLEGDFALHVSVLHISVPDIGTDDMVVLISDEPVPETKGWLEVQKWLDPGYKPEDEGGESEEKEELLEPEMEESINTARRLLGLKEKGKEDDPVKVGDLVQIVDKTSFRVEVEEAIVKAVDENKGVEITGNTVPVSQKWYSKSYWFVSVLESKVNEDDSDNKMSEKESGTSVPEMLNTIIRAYQTAVGTTPVKGNRTVIEMLESYWGERSDFRVQKDGIYSVDADELMTWEDEKKFIQQEVDKEGIKKIYNQALEVLKSAKKAKR